MTPNLAHNFVHHSKTNPDQIALVFPKNKTWTQDQVTFGQLLLITHEFQEGLKREGFLAGQKIVILIPLSVELYAFVIALFSLGIVPVFLEPEMPLKKMIQALNDSKARAVVSVNALLKFRYILPPLWRKKLYSLDSKGLLVKEMTQLRAKPEMEEICLTLRTPTDHALITYTTGSTGRPKGADRNHGILSRQHLISRKYWPEKLQEVDMPAFPMIAFQNLSCGITTVIPEAEPSEIINQIINQGVTRLSAAPAFLKSLTKELLTKGQTLEGIRSVIAGGAPVSRRLCQNIVNAFPNSENFVVYGSTEVEPISFINMKEIIASKDDGYLVGRPIGDLKVEVVKILKENFTFNQPDWSSERVSPNVQGEILVQGNHVVQSYLNNDAANKETKIKDSVGKIWHRTGDLGFWDDQGRLWITGRISDRIWNNNELAAPLGFEQNLEEILEKPRVAFIASDENFKTNHCFVSGIKELQIENKIKDFCRDCQIPLDKIIFLKEMPVDRRHQWKIDRISLRHHLKRNFPSFQKQTKAKENSSQDISP